MSEINYQEAYEREHEKCADLADKIVVLADGVAAEEGTPYELKKKNGLYARMVKLQTESQNWKLK